MQCQEMDLVYYQSIEEIGLGQFTLLRRESRPDIPEENTTPHQ
jgi:hypothetical protein